MKLSIFFAVSSADTILSSRTRGGIFSTLTDRSLNMKDPHGWNETDWHSELEGWGNWLEEEDWANTTASPSTTPSGVGDAPGP